MPAYIIRRCTTKGDFLVKEIFEKVYKDTMKHICNDFDYYVMSKDMFFLGYAFESVRNNSESSL